MELAERRAEVFQLRQELQLLRDEVAQSRLAVNPVKNTMKFNVRRKSYWDVDRAARSLKRKKIKYYLRNAAEILPSRIQTNRGTYYYEIFLVITQYYIRLSLFIPFIMFHAITKE